MTSSTGIGTFTAQTFTCFFMPLQKLNLFISYAHEDSTIAVAVLNMLQQTFGESLAEVFLDIEGIRLGGDIKDGIKNALKRADVLIVVSTGVGRPSHDWTGFELGYFEATHADKNTDEGVRGKVITICLETSVPGAIQTRRYVPLGIRPALLERSREEFEKNLEIVKNDEFILFLGDILEATEGIKLADRRDLLDEYKRKVKEFKAEIFRVLKGRVRRIRKPQKQFLIRYDSSALNETRQDLPGNASITGIGGALSLFGISDDDTTLFRKELDGGAKAAAALNGTTISWEAFRGLVSNHPLGEFWCASLARVVISAGVQTVDVDNSQVIASHDQVHRYRLVLTTSTTFYNNEVEASLYLVEALTRRDYGWPDTTLLLKGLHIVCRFRFLFLESDSDFYHFNVKRLAAGLLPNTARQLVGELDLLYSDMLQADLHKPGSWKAFVPLDQLEKMSMVWAPIEEAIRKLCADAVRESGNHEALTRLSSELAAQLKKIEEQMTDHNVTLIKSMASKLTELATHSDPVQYPVTRPS